RASHELHSDVRRATVSDPAHHLYRAGAPLAGDTFCCNGQQLPNTDAPRARMIDRAGSDEIGARPSFPNKISNPAAAPSSSLRSLQGQGGELDLASSTHEDQNP